MTIPVVRITRDFDFSQEQVFQAWLDPAQVSHWMSPGATAAADIDARTGGRYSVRHTSDGQDLGGFEATITILEPPRRIVWDWGFVGPGDRANPIMSVLEITLDPLEDGRTRLSLVHTHLDDLHSAVPDVADKVEAGWRLVLDQLAASVEADR
jgi:uncharacterized protein YndB with AHSA1/START domain